jgi:hypothetical protein
VRPPGGSGFRPQDVRPPGGSGFRPRDARLPGGSGSRPEDGPSPGPVPRLRDVSPAEAGEEPSSGLGDEPAAQRQSPGARDAERFGLGGAAAGNPPPGDRPPGDRPPGGPREGPDRDSAERPAQDPPRVPAGEEDAG